MRVANIRLLNLISLFACRGCGSPDRDLMEATRNFAGCRIQLAPLDRAAEPGQADYIGDKPAGHIILRASVGEYVKTNEPCRQHASLYCSDLSNDWPRCRTKVSTINLATASGTRRSPTRKSSASVSQHSELLQIYVAEPKSSRKSASQMADR
jgi:hypothetical protein